jgi:hypothetical protein
VDEEALRGVAEHEERMTGDERQGRPGGWSQHLHILRGNGAEQARTADVLEVPALLRAARGESAADEGLAIAPATARAGLLFRRAEALAEAERLAGSDPRAKQASARVEKLLSDRRG